MTDIPKTYPGTDLLFNCPACDHWNTLEVTASNIDQEPQPNQVVAWWRAYTCTHCKSSFVQYCDVIKIDSALFADLLSGERVGIERTLKITNNQSTRGSK